MGMHLMSTACKNVRSFIHCEYSPLTSLKQIQKYVNENCKVAESSQP